MNTKRRYRDPAVAAPPPKETVKENHYTEQETLRQAAASYSGMVLTGGSQAGHNFGGFNLHVGDSRDMNNIPWERMPINSDTRNAKTLTPGNGQLLGSAPMMPTPPNRTQPSTAPPGPYAQGVTQPREVRQPPTAGPSYPLTLTPPSSQPQIPPAMMQHQYKHQDVTTPESPFRIEFSDQFRVFDSFKTTGHVPKQCTTKDLLKFQKDYESELNEIVSPERIGHFEDEYSRLQKANESKRVGCDEKWNLEYHLTLAWLFRLKSRAYLTQAYNIEGWSGVWETALERNQAAIDLVEETDYVPTSPEEQLRCKRLSLYLCVDRGWLGIGELRKILAQAPPPMDVSKIHLKASELGGYVGSAKDAFDDMSSLHAGMGRGVVPEPPVVNALEVAYREIKDSLPVLEQMEVAGRD